MISQCPNPPVLVCARLVDAAGLPGERQIHRQVLAKSELDPLVGDDCAGPSLKGIHLEST